MCNPDLRHFLSQHILLNSDPSFLYSITPASISLWFKILLKVFSPKGVCAFCYSHIHLCILLFFFSFRLLSFLPSFRDSVSQCVLLWFETRSLHKLGKHGLTSCIACLLFVSISAGFSLYSYIRLFSS